MSTEPGQLQAAIWSNTSHGMRDRVFWVMAYDTAARADELLGLNIENIDAANREAVIIGKGGNAERIYYSSTNARLLPRLLTHKTLPRVSGPLFVGDRRPRSHLAPPQQTSTPSPAGPGCRTGALRRYGKPRPVGTRCISSDTPGSPTSPKLVRM